MILIPCILLAVFPPGLLFPQMATRMSGPGRVGRPSREGDKGDTEKRSQPGGQENHKQVASGDESGTGEGQVNEKPTTSLSA